MYGVCVYRNIRPHWWGKGTRGGGGKKEGGGIGHCTRGKTAHGGWICRLTGRMALVRLWSESRSDTEVTHLSLTKDPLVHSHWSILVWLWSGDKAAARYFQIIIRSWLMLVDQFEFTTYQVSRRFFFFCARLDLRYRYIRMHFLWCVVSYYFKNICSSDGGNSSSSNGSSNSIST
jgi:hypothetical protein